jgi:hypothetical protein
MQSTISLQTCVVSLIVTIVLSLIGVTAKAYKKAKDRNFIHSDTRYFGVHYTREDDL